MHAKLSERCTFDKDCFDKFDVWHPKLFTARKKRNGIKAYCRTRPTYRRTYFDLGLFLSKPPLLIALLTSARLPCRKSKYGEGTLYWVEVKVSGSKKWFSCSMCFSKIWFICPICPRRTRRSVLEEYLEENKDPEEEVPDLELSDMEFPDSCGPGTKAGNGETGAWTKYKWFWFSIFAWGLGIP